MIPWVFLPGTLCDERVWLPTWKALSSSARLYVPLQWATDTESMLALTNDRCAEFEKVDLVGFSLGGFIATQWALAHPNKVRSLHLVGYCPQGLSQDEIDRRKQLTNLLNKGRFNPDSEQYCQAFVHPTKLKSDDVAGVVRAMASDLGAATLAGQITATTKRADVTQALQQAPFNVFLYGAEDDSVAPIEQLDCTKLPLTSFPATGHMIPLEQPEALAKALIANQNTLR